MKLLTKTVDSTNSGFTGNSLGGPGKEDIYTYVYTYYF